MLIAIALSAVAAYFSVLGLMSIFSADPNSVMVMAIVLEVAKVATAFWAHLHWKELKYTIKIYLFLAIIILMGITCLGVYGHLAKAHIVQQNEISSTVGTKLNIIDAKIQAKNSKIEDINKRIKVIDDVVDEASSKGYVSKALQLNKKYEKDKNDLYEKKAEFESDKLTLEEEKIKLQNEKVQKESKVGPIKYVAKLIYDDVDDKQLDTAVRWLIITLIVVFDPLAIALLLGTGSIASRYEKSKPIMKASSVIIPKPKTVPKKIKIEKNGNGTNRVTIKNE